MEKILKDEKVKKATRINVSFFGENGKIAFLTVEAEKSRKNSVNAIRYSYQLLEEKGKKEGEILLDGNFKKLYPKNELTDENILDEIIKKEGIKTLSSLYIS